MNGLPVRKRIRLPTELYAEPSVVCSITIGTRGRAPVFSDQALALSAARVLRALAGNTGVIVHAYCIMPDHVHLVIAPSTDCDIITFVKRFKDLTLREAWKREVRGSFWQTSFWDHFLRGDEDLAQVVRYVLNNPVRRGIVGSAQDYPYAGSLVFDAGDET